MPIGILGKGAEVNLYNIFLQNIEKS